MDKVTAELVPFIVTWQGKQPFHKPNSVQDAALIKVVSNRLVEEAFYEFATKHDPTKFGGASAVPTIAKSLADAVLLTVGNGRKA